MLWLIFSVLALLPILGFVAAFKLSNGRYGFSVLIAAFVGGAVGAFLASAGSAMATVVSPSDALVRGGTIGFVAGGALGCLAAVYARVRGGDTSR